MAELRDEHRTIEAVLSETCAAPCWDPAWAARLLSRLDLLRWHILKEQDGVFPAALATLRTADWEAMDAVRDRVGSRLPHAIGAWPHRSRSGTAAATTQPSKQSAA